MRRTVSKVLNTYFQANDVHDELGNKMNRRAFKRLWNSLSSDQRRAELLRMKSKAKTQQRELGASMSTEVKP